MKLFGNGMTYVLQTKRAALPPVQAVKKLKLGRIWGVVRGESPPA